MEYVDMVFDSAYFDGDGGKVFDDACDEFVNLVLEGFVG